MRLKGPVPQLEGLVGEISWSWRKAGSDFKYVKGSVPIGIPL